MRRGIKENLHKKNNANKLGDINKKPKSAANNQGATAV